VILWLDGSHSPAENMRRDAALLAAAEGGAEPVLRLFSFAPHGITLGAREEPVTALDLERCRADGVPWTVRPTGGRAIFHAEEWTYSLATPIEDPAWGGSQSEAYRRASRLVVDSLVALGVPAELVRGSRAPAGSAAACFASTARHEIELEGRKLVGSAQRRGRNGLLQQGSVLLGDGHLRLADYARVGDRAAFAARLAAAACPAGPWLAGRTALRDWADALQPLIGGVRRLEGPEGLFVLTLENPASYTASLTQLEQ
jgi:lipoate-protein ligase A